MSPPIDIYAVAAGLEDAARAVWDAEPRMDDGALSPAYTAFLEAQAGRIAVQAFVDELSMAPLIPSENVLTSVYAMCKRAG